MVDHRVRHNPCAGTNAHSFPQITSGTQPNTLSNLNTGSQNGTRSDGNPVCDFRQITDPGCLINEGHHQRSGIKQGRDSRTGQPRVICYQVIPAAISGVCGTHDNRAGLAVREQSAISVVKEESELIGVGISKPGDATYLKIGITMVFKLKLFGYLRKLQPKLLFKCVHFFCDFGSHIVQLMAIVSALSW